MTVISFLGLFQEALQEWSHDRAQRLGAALAYYALFSIAPLLVIVIAIAGLVFGEAAAKGQVVGAITGQVGAEAAGAVEQLIAGVHASGSSLSATIISVIILFIGATNLFAQLKDALNTIWHVRHKPPPSFIWGILHVARDRLMSTVMVASVGIVLLAALAMSAALTAFSGWLESITPGASLVWRGGNLLIGFSLTTSLFALIFKVLPDVQIAWRVVWVGALVTALLFNAGAFLIGLYLRYGSITSVLGVAGSFVVLLIWAYYSAQIVFFGAKFAQVYANAISKPIMPAPRAIHFRPPKSAV